MSTNPLHAEFAGTGWEAHDRRVALEGLQRRAAALREELLAMSEDPQFDASWEAADALCAALEEVQA